MGPRLPPVPRRLTLQFANCHLRSRAFDRSETGVLNGYCAEDFFDPVDFRLNIALTLAD